MQNQHLQEVLIDALLFKTLQSVQRKQTLFWLLVSCDFNLERNSASNVPKNGKLARNLQVSENPPADTSGKLRWEDLVEGAFLTTYYILLRLHRLHVSLRSGVSSGWKRILEAGCGVFWTLQCAFSTASAPG